MAFIFLLSFLVFIIYIAVHAKSPGAFSSQRKKWPYRKKENLLTKAEKDFFFVLQEIVGNDFLIFSKVRIIDILYIPRGMENHRYYHYLNRVQSKHVDFLICDRGNVKPLLVIELDDSSHFQQNRVERDEFVDEIFEDANLPILHVKFSFGYDKQNLLAQIKGLIDKKQ